MLKSILTLLVTLFAFAGLASGQATLQTPQAGTTQRKAIIDALRGPVEAKLKQKVVFQVDHLKVQNGWVFMRGVPRQPSRKPIDYRGTPYQKSIDDGIFDDWICALLKNEAGKWRVVTFVIGATDVAYIGWDEKYKAPPAIFK